MGVRTGLGVFNVPKEQQVTMDFPMADSLSLVDNKVP